MWKVYKYNGHYIQGDLVSKHKTEDAALKRAAKEIGFTYADKIKKDKEVLIWLDDQNHNPIGIITRKKRG